MRARGSARKHAKIGTARARPLNAPGGAEHNR